MIFYMVIISISQTKSYNERLPKNDVVMFGDSIFKYLQNWGIFIFIYLNIVNYHQTYTTLKFPTIRRMNKQTFYVFTILLVIFLTFGISSYVSLGSSARVLDLFPLRKALPGSKDIPMVILKSSEFSYNSF